LLPIALQNKKNNNIFSPEKRKRKKTKEEKKDMQVQKQCSGGCQGFLKKYSFFLAKR